MESFEPALRLIVSDPQQVKAFTDPLRIRVLDVLTRREATNQQLAETLGEPQAKVLYHIRFLLDVGLIRLVNQQIKGGNVEKYYRAVARMFSLRPSGEDATVDRASAAAAAFAVVQQEIEASEIAWPDQPVAWERRRVRLPPQRADEFSARFLALVAEYWGGPPDFESPVEETPIVEEDPTAPVLCFATVLYRDPTETSQNRERCL
jgi:DNA-binding transcriptional ArsR family regulator